MNILLITLSTLVASGNAGDGSQPYSTGHPSGSQATVYRAQSPTYFDAPAFPQSPGGPPPTYSPAPGGYPGSPGGQFSNPFQPGVQPYDPFLGQPGAAVSPYGFGLNQGDVWPFNYQPGCHETVEIGFLADESTDRGFGDFGVFELDVEKRFNTPVIYGWTWSLAPQFNMRLWDGPSDSRSFAPGTLGLPGQVYRFGLDMAMVSPVTPQSPYSVELGFTPSINSDFEQSVTSDAWQFDFRGAIYYQTSPYLTFALGALFWDRVDDQVLPYGGVIWNPGDRWEWRIMFPESRVSYYLGNPWGFASWLYVRGEYHVEAYEITRDPTGIREEIELEDWRVLLGLRNDNQWVQTFIEAGWVFGRDVEFGRGSPGFDISSGFILRAGMQF